MPNNPYYLGRLLAALEHIGVVEQHRLYTQASSNPIVLPPYIAQATMRGEGAREILMPIMSALSTDAFERPLTDVEGSSFGLGYFHQHAQFRAGQLPQMPEDEPGLTERLEIRIEPELKAWIVANGGGKLLRALARTARERQEG